MDSFCENAYYVKNFINDQKDIRTSMHYIEDKKLVLPIATRNVKTKLQMIFENCEL